MNKHVAFVHEKKKKPFKCEILGFSVTLQIHKPDKILVNLIEICEGYHDENLQQLRSVAQW